MPSLRRILTPFGPKASKAVEDLSNAAPRNDFYAAAGRLGPDASVLELGTRRSVEGRPTHSRGGMPNVRRENYVMADVELGEDVDVVADLHALPRDWAGRFHAVIAAAVFEHLERPWIAAKEIERVLAPGGICYIATHQTFPLHGYPSDFFRFSKEALSLIVTDAGMRVVDVAYEHRTRIVPPPAIVPPALLDRWNADCPSYVGVHLFAEKAPSPPRGTAAIEGA